MTEPTGNDKPTVISATNARGARGPKSGTIGDTLLPMLIGGLVLAVVSVSVVYFVIH